MKAYSDGLRDVLFSDVGSLMGLEKPTVAFNVKYTFWKEVAVVQKACCKSVNRVPYTVHKQCLNVFKRPHWLLKSTWKYKWTSREWRKANRTHIPKELNSLGITKYRPISLLNFQTKILFSVITSSVMKYLSTWLKTNASTRQCKLRVILEISLFPILYK